MGCSAGTSAGWPSAWRQGVCVCDKPPDSSSSSLMRSLVMSTLHLAHGTGNTAKTTKSNGGNRCASAPGTLSLQEFYFLLYAQADDLSGNVTIRGVYGKKLDLTMSSLFCLPSFPPAWTTDSGDVLATERSYSPCAVLWQAFWEAVRLRGSGWTCLAETPW